MHFPQHLAALQLLAAKMIVDDLAQQSTGRAQHVRVVEPPGRDFQ